jgi:hypothetical protein
LKLGMNGHLIVFQKVYVFSFDQQFTSEIRSPKVPKSMFSVVFFVLRN